MKNNSGLVWRGALGGLVGAPLVSIGLMLQDYSRLGYVPYSGFFEIIAIPIFAAYGLVLGAVTGFLLWLIVLWLGPTRIHLLVRLIVGAMIVPWLFLVTMPLRDDRNNGFRPPTTMEIFVQIVLYTTAFGILPAVFARPKVAESEEPA